MTSDESVPAMDHLMGEQRRNFFDRLDFVERFCAAHRWDSNNLTPQRSAEIMRSAEFRRLMARREELRDLA